MSPAAPIITLTTDFGTADGFVGAMHGKALSINPGVRLVDISHDIAPQQVAQGAWCLRRAAAQFPRGTIHVAVVDPGVGSGRAGIVVETERDLLIGPDNGLLSLAARDGGLRSIRRIAERPGFWHHSTTFDGLTCFMPVAAHLSAGMAPADIGPMQGEMERLHVPEPRMTPEGVVGELLYFDRFGNGITNIRRALVPGGKADRVVLAEERTVPLHGHYADLGAEPGGMGALWNADDLLELVVNGGSFASRLLLQPGGRVRIPPAESGG